MIDITVLTEFYPLLVKGILISIQIASFSCILGSILGTITAMILAGKSRFAKLIAHIYVTIIRGTPMLVQIAATFYILKMAGFSITAFWSAIISIGLNSGAYMSQVILSGIKSVGKGQVEAARTLGFSSFQISRFIVLPQAIKAVIPALGNEFITLIKDSSLASTIGVYELTKQGEIIMSQTFDAPTIYLSLGVVYLLMTSVVTVLMGLIDKKMNYHAKH